MKLIDLDNYAEITIQCHDNPDGDSIGAGYALYHYFSSHGKQVRLIYSGKFKIKKANLVLMVEKLNIPIEYVEQTSEIIQGLLITVDCQYGAGNVTFLPAEEVAIIDHHQIEITGVLMCEINSNLGSCSTLVWRMLMEAKYEYINDIVLGTALYYGLFSDTNQFSEIYNPLDRDMRDSVNYNKGLISLFRNSNLSLKELEIAGIAMIRYIYNDDHNYAIIKAQPCDPNILGLISDLLLQVEEVYTCVVYNQLEDGFKLSVRSCVNEVKASELAVYLTDKIGSGGGHFEKAGGFINLLKYEKFYPTLHSEAYFSDKMNEYFDSIEIIYAKDYDIDVTGMKCYIKKKTPFGYVRAEDVLPIGTPITVRTLEGDIDMVIDPKFYIMIGIKGEVYPIKKENFEHSYSSMEGDFKIDAEYTPTIKNRLDGSSKELIDYAHFCISTGEVIIHAKVLDKTIKVFPNWDEEKYMLGKPGDYIAVRCDDIHDIYVVEKDVFSKTYAKMY
ncbi:MAG TPA: DHH family phosphoesterase [Lachnospiraceae bacterium]|nr:DHH family phosphoesterase [Lachnospiraceae bacterium]